MAPGISVKVAVVGGGSIGLRHQRVLQDLNHEVVLVSGHKDSAKYKSLQTALDQESFEYVVVASATSQHFDDLDCLIKNNFIGRVLIEKPVFDKSKHTKPHKFAAVAVGYNLRFHPAVLWLQQTLPKLGAVTSASFYVGQYLPNWRPGSDYQNSSSAKHLSGGGVLRDLSHELDLVQNTLGDWQKLTAIGGKFSNLNIETDDTFAILMQTQKCEAVSLQLNYTDQLKQRSITLNGDNGTINIDLVNSVSTFNDSRTNFDVKPDDTYIAQHKAMLSSDMQNICTFGDATKIVETIEAIEKSVKKSKWIIQ